MTSDLVAESIPASQAYDRWRELRDRFADEGYWPVIVEDADTLQRFRERWEETREEFEEVESGSARPSIPEGSPDDRPIVAAYLESVIGPRETVWIASFRCLEPAEVPARLLEGGDLCPAPEDHLTTLRRWAERYGAEPLVVGRDSLTLAVRPVRSLEEAKEAAGEQFRYAGEENGESDAIAPHLVGLPIWPFWWD